MVLVTPRTALRAGDDANDRLLQLIVMLIVTPTRLLPTYMIPEDWIELLPPHLRRLLRDRRTDSPDLRMWALDQVVGPPCLTAATLFDATGHTEAATVLRQFVYATGPQSREFGWNSQFAQGFARSGTTRASVTNALRIWRERRGGFQAQNGTITGLGKSFSPISLEVQLLPIPGPSVSVEMSPEANVIGSFGYTGRLIGNNQAEWSARNHMSLPSFFAEHWTSQIGISLVSENHRPDRYGTTQQWIHWRTTLDGAVVR